MHLNTSPVHQLIHPGAIINTSFNTSRQENNTSDTSFNTLKNILPFFDTSNVLDDVLDVLTWTSNTSLNTSQYILLICLYIPIHPACIGMYWRLIHPQYTPCDLLTLNQGCWKSREMLAACYTHSARETASDSVTSNAPSISSSKSYSDLSSSSSGGSDNERSDSEKREFVNPSPNVLARRGDSDDSDDQWFQS